MLGLDLNIVVHKLAIFQATKPIKQPQR